VANEPIYSFAALQNRLHVRGNLVALTALRIGTGRSNDVIGNDLPVLRDSLGAPFVPGASLKGAFRARVEALVRAVVQDTDSSHFQQLEDLSNELRKIRGDTTDAEQRRKLFDGKIQEIIPDGAALDFEHLEQRTRAVSRFKQQNRDLSDEQFNTIIWKQSTLIDLTFGSPELAGRIFFKDALVDRSLWFDQFEIRNGVAINRDTETVEQGLLYDYEVVPAGMRFGFELVLENAAPWQLGMVLLALRPWQNGDVQIGGFRSRGLGHVQLTDLTGQYTAIQTVDDVLSLLGYGDESATRHLPLNDPDEQMTGWFEAFKQALITPQEAIAKGATFDA
jgi:CRISPR-associated RAMP protein (TIGR02581 family)